MAQQLKKITILIFSYKKKENTNASERRNVKSKV